MIPEYTLEDVEAYCTHELLEHGVHAFSFKQQNRRAVEVYIGQLASLYATRDARSPVLRILVDGTDGLGPINYGIKLGRELNRQYPDHGKVRIAFLIDNPTVAHLIDTMVRLMRLKNEKFRYFTSEQRETALTWLLEDS